MKRLWILPGASFLVSYTFLLLNCLMMMPAAVDVAVFIFLVRGFAQADNFYIEMQFLARQRVIEIELDRFVADRVDPRRHGLAVLVGDLDLNPDFQGNAWRELLLGDFHKSFRVKRAVAFIRLDDDFFALADRHPVEFLFQPGNNIARAL